MGQLTVRKVDDQIVRRLKMRAARNGRSMEAEHRQILRRALEDPPAEHLDLKRMLLEMPEVGDDEDFARIEGTMRDVGL